MQDISDNFGKGRTVSQFMNTGVLLNGKIYTAKTNSQYDGYKTIIRDILIDENEVPKEFYINEEDIDKWSYLKGAKKEIRRTSNGYEYNYAEGSMVFPDSLYEPSRTIITGEGGKSPSRFKHVISTNRGLRRLTPVELERLNMFPDNQ